MKKKIYKCKACDSTVSDSQKFCQECGGKFIIDDGNSEYEMIKNFVKRVQKETGIKFSESEGFTGVSFYATIRGKKWRIANHAQTEKWAAKYGWVEKDNSLILHEGGDLKKEENDFIKNIKKELKKPKHIVYVTLNQLVPIFKSESDIKPGKYKVGTENWEILNVNKEEKEAEVNINKERVRWINFKYIMNWETSVPVKKIFSES